MAGKFSSLFINEKIRNSFAVIAIALVMLWPPLLNGEPFYMPDTPSYIRAADAGIYKLTGLESAWSDEFQEHYDPGSAADDNGAAAIAGPAEFGSADAPVALAGRSVYYGTFLYIGQLAGNFWLIAVLQSLLVALCILLTIRALGGGKAEQGPTKNPFLFGAGLALLTPVGFFSGYLMPDIFGGLGLLAFLHLLVFWHKQGVVERGFWFLLLSAALLFHNTNILLVGALLVCALAAHGLKILTVTRQPVLLIVLAFMLAFAGQSAFSWGVTKFSGNSPVMPPFLAARLIDDGPGYEYLEKHCPQNPSGFCKVLDLEYYNHDSLLWSKDPKKGIFTAAPNRDRRALAGEERAFLIDVVREHPLAVVQVSITSALEQLVTFDLPNFNYNGKQKRQFLEKIPASMIDTHVNSKAFQNTMPTRFWELSTVLLALLAAGWIIRLVYRSYREQGRLTSPVAFCFLLLLAILGNAAICGALSGAKGRYQMRLIWVLPLAAVSTIHYRRSVVTGKAQTG